MLAWLHRFVQAYAAGDEDGRHAFPQAEQRGKLSDDSLAQCMPALPHDSPEGNPPVDPAESEIDSGFGHSRNVAKVVFDDAETFRRSDDHHFGQDSPTSTCLDFVQRPVQASALSAVASGSSSTKRSPGAMTAIPMMSPRSGIYQPRGSSMNVRERRVPNSERFIEEIEYDGYNHGNCLYRMLDLDPELRVAFQI